MPAAEMPSYETAGLRTLLECHFLNTEPKNAFDDLTLLAAKMHDAPIALVSLIDRERQWFKIGTRSARSD